MVVLTKEKREEKIKRLNKIASWAVSYGADHNVMIPALEAKEMAESYIASLTAEPVAVLYKSGNVLTKKECADDKIFSICCKVETALFTAPPVLRALYPEKLPCDVSVSPNATFRKGVKTQVLINALIRKSRDLEEMVEQHD